MQPRRVIRRLQKAVRSVLWFILYLFFQKFQNIGSTCGLVAMTAASHAEGRQFDPGQVYLRLALAYCMARLNL